MLVRTTIQAISIIVKLKINDSQNQVVIPNY